MPQSLYRHTTLGVAADRVRLPLPFRATADDDAGRARALSRRRSPAARTATPPAPSSATADMKRYLGGSDVGFAIPGRRRVRRIQNLTPDKETGLGAMDETSRSSPPFRTGKTPGRTSELSRGHALPGAVAPLPDPDASGDRRLSQEHSRRSTTRARDRFGPGDRR